MSRFQAYGVPALFCAGFFVVVLACGFIDDLVLENIVENVLLVIACLAYRRHRHIAARPGGYTVVNIALVLVLMVAIWFVTQLVAAVIFTYGDAGFDGYSAALSSINPLVLFVLSCTLGPLAEEYLFRGIVYANLRERINVFAAAAISSLAFGAIHGTLVHIPLCLLLGFLSCAIYERTRRIRGCFALHALYNAFEFTVVYVPIGAVFFTPLVAIPLYLLVFVAVVLVLAKSKGVYGAKAYSPQTASEKIESSAQT